MKLEKPVKRHKALQPLSRDHHDGLLLCWKIRTGLNKNIKIERIKKYTDWFFQYHLLPHFEMEEKYIFPILGTDNESIKKAVAEHGKLKRLFESETEITKNLNHIEEELEAHIRFEERILFNTIQEQATSEQLEIISQLHTNIPFCEAEDKFWE